MISRMQRKDHKGLGSKRYDKLMPRSTTVKACISMAAQVGPPSHDKNRHGWGPNVWCRPSGWPRVVPPTGLPPRVPNKERLRLDGISVQGPGPTLHDVREWKIAGIGAYRLVLGAKHGDHIDQSE